jgi:hypothetical protein
MRLETQTRATEMPASVERRSHRNRHERPEDAVISEPAQPDDVLRWLKLYFGCETG